MTAILMLCLLMCAFMGVSLASDDLDAPETPEIPDAPALQQDDLLAEETDVVNAPVFSMLLQNTEEQEEEQEQEEEEETEEEYSAPAGSAYIEEVGADISYENTAETNAIQSAIADALTYAKSDKGNGVATVVVEDGVYEGGLDITLAEGGNLLSDLIDLFGDDEEQDYSDLTLRIVAHDALDENGNITADSAGNVVVKGDVAISGINVMLAGIYFSLRETIHASETDGFCYYGTAKDDALKEYIQERVVAKLNEGPVPTLGVTVDGGEGNDTLLVRLVNATEFSFSLDDADNLQDVFGLRLDFNKIKLSLDGGAGMDTLSYEGGTSAVISRWLTLEMTGFVTEQLEASGASARYASELTLAGGENDDVLSVDTTAAFATMPGTVVTAEGGGGYDRLHLSGKLQKSNTNSALAYSGGVYTVHALAELKFLWSTFEFDRVFRIRQSADVETVTDALENKNTVNAMSGMSAAAMSFTDYLLDMREITAPIAFQGSGLTGTPLLANLIILAGENEHTIQGINAPNFNVRIIGLRIMFSGVVNCLNLLIEAFTEDVALTDGLELEIKTDDLGQEEDDVSLDLGLYKADATVDVTFTEAAAINATGVVDVYAGTAQDEPFLPIGDFANFLTFKMSDTRIAVKGIVNAKSVRMRTDVSIALDLENGPLSVVIPVAVGAADAVNHITVAGPHAAIRAQGDVLLSAKTEVFLTAQAIAGAVPITMALTVALTDTAVEVGGTTVPAENPGATPTPLAGSVTAGGSVCLLASARTSTLSTVAGKPTNSVQSAPKSGGFLAVNILMQEARAAILGDGSVEAGGDLSILASAVADAENAAVSIPQSDEAEELGIVTAFSLVQKALASLVQYGKSIEFINGLIQKINPSDMNFITSLVLGPVLDPEGTPKQIMGAMSFVYFDNCCSALVDTSAIVKAGGLLALNAYATSYADARADASLYKSEIAYSEGTPAKAFGIALGLLLYEHSNTAVINRGAIESKGLYVNADSGHSATRLIVKSGHMPKNTDFGLAGAVAVQVSDQHTEAVIRKSASYTLTGGGITVTASGTGGYVTVADGSGKRQTPQIKLGFVTFNLYTVELGGTGIGAGIAVAVTYVTMRAAIEDDTALTISDSATLSGVTVSASYTGNDQMTAAAGAEGGKSVVPVLALQIADVAVDAYAGHVASGAVLPVTGDFCVRSMLSVQRKMNADAKSVGSGVGFGAAAGVAILNDGAHASLRRSAKGRNIYVESQSVSRFDAMVLAGAKGAKPKSGTTNSDTDTNNTQQDIDDTLKNKNNTNTNTDEETDGEADLFLTTILGLGSSLIGKLKDTNLGIFSNLIQDPPKAQTSEGSVSVAAGFAVNIHKNISKALIDQHTVITAEVSGGEGGEVRVTSLNDTDAVIQGSASAVNSKEGVGVGVALNKVSYENIAYLLAERVTAAKLTVQADIADAADKQTVEEIVLSIITYLAADPAHMENLIRVILADQGKTLDQVIREENDKLADGQKLSEAAVKARLLEELANQLVNGNTAELAGSIMGELISGIITGFFDILFSEEFWMSLLTGEGSPLSDFLDEISFGSKVVSTRLERAISRALAIKYGSNDEMDGVGHRFSTQAVSGVGASNIGVAGAAGIALIRGVTEASIGAHATVAVSGDLLVSAECAEKVYTTASASTDKKGQAVKKNSDSSGTSVGIGASSAVADVVMRVHAGICESCIVQAGTLSIMAKGYNDADAIAIAGSDPIARRPKDTVVDPTLGVNMPLNDDISTKEVAVDASAALNMLENDIRAFVQAGTTLIIGAGNTIVTELQTGTDAGGEPIYETVSFYLFAKQTGKTRAQASGFASGEQTAVGACAAVNLIESAVQADFAGTGVVGGRARIAALSHDEDDADALATVVGASLDRYLDKLRKLLGLLSVGTNPPGGLNRMIGDKLNSYLSASSSSLLNLIPGGSLAMNALQMLGLKMPETTNNVTDKLSNTDVPTIESPNPEQQGQSINIAAAVAVNATKHRSLLSVTGSLTANALTLLSENRENFLTYGSGATVTVFDTNANNISVGVAVGRNCNSAKSVISGTLIALGSGSSADNANGAIKIEAVTTQNMDGVYRGLLGAQAVAGSVSGTGGKAGAAGAVAVLIADAVTGVTLGGTLKGGAVTLSASEKSKLAVRAGSVMASTGTSVGVGASFALIYANNEIFTTVESGAHITAATLSVSAVRLPVTDEDYALPFDRATLFTVDVQEERDKGIVNLTTEDGPGGKYSVEITLDTRDLISTLNFLNFLSSVNYYLESVAGVLNAGATASASLTGAASVLYNQSTTSATIADGARIVLTGDLTLEAQAQTNSRLIGGALTLTTASTAVGLNMTALYNEDAVSATIGKHTHIEANNLSVSALDKPDALLITVAASATTGSTGVGGTLNAILLNGTVLAQIGEGSEITARGLLRVIAESQAGLKHIAASLAASSGVAAGGTFAFMMTGRSVTASIGANADITAGSASIAARNTEDMILYLASASGTTGGAGVAGTVGVLLTESAAVAGVGNAAAITATAGDILIDAIATINERIILGAVTGSLGGMAAGATVTVGIFDNLVSATAGDGARLSAQRGSVILRSTAQNDALMLTMAGAGSASVTLAGAVTVLLSQSEVLSIVGGGAIIEAYDTVAVLAAANEDLNILAGEIAGGATGIGATLSTLVGSSRVLARIGDYSNVSGRALVDQGGVTLPNRNEKRRGIAVFAASQRALLLMSFSGVGAGGVAVAGVVNTLVLENDTQALIGQHVALNQMSITREAGGQLTGSTDDVGGGAEQEIYVEADDESHIYNFAGGVTVSPTAGVGVATVVGVYEKNVRAAMGDGVRAYAKGDITVAADSCDRQILITLAFGVSGTSISPSVNTLVFSGNVLASAGGRISSGGTISVKAVSAIPLAVFAAAVTAGGTAVGGAAVIIVFESVTRADILAGAVLTANAVTVAASSQETLTSAAAGGAAGSTAVSGAVAVVITRVTTVAAVQALAVLEAATGDVKVTAEDSFSVLGTAACAGVAGTAVGVVAQVVIAHNTLTASVFDGASLTATMGSVLVTATANRAIQMYAGSVAAGVTAGIAATLMTAVIGGRLSGDAASALSGSFDADACFDCAFGAANARAAGGRPVGVSALLAGDGVLQSETKIENLEIEKQYCDSELNDTAYADGGSGAARGENAELDESANEKLTDAANLGSARPAYDPEDCVMATVGDNALIDAGKDVTVQALESLTVDLITGTIGAGGYAGVGAGVAVAVLYSNVIAAIGAQTQVSAGGAISVHASSKAADTATRYSADDQPDELTAYIGSLKSASMRALSISGGAALASVQAAAAVITLSSNVIATFAGKSSRAQSLTVKAIADYANLVVATLTVSGGAVAVGASVAIIINQTGVEAAIGGAAALTDIAEIHVLSTALMTSLASAMACAAGGIAGNGAVALIIDRRGIETYIGRGVKITNAGSVTVLSTVQAVARATILGVSLSITAAVDLTAAVVILSATVLTYAGDTPQGLPENAFASGTGGRIATGALTVKSDVTLTGYAGAASLTLSGVAVSGNILLVLHDAVVRTGVYRMNVTVSGSVSVLALMQAKAEAKLDAAAVGGTAIGLSTAYVRLRNDNRAEIDTTTATVSASTLNLSAGSADKPNSANAAAHTLAANAGLVSVGVNAAIADNQSINHATVLGSGTLNVQNLLSVRAYGVTSAVSDITGLSVGGISILASFVLAVDRSEQLAAIDGGSLTAAALHVESQLNEPEAGNVTKAALTIGGGALASVRASFAAAYGRSQSIARVRALSLSVHTGSVTLRSGGNAGVLAEVKNFEGFSGIAANVVAGLAFAQSSFISTIDLPAGSQLLAGSVTVETEYTAYADSTVEPSAGGAFGANVTAIGLAVNLSIAKVSAHAEASVTGTGGMELPPAASSVRIAANGSVRAESRIPDAGIDLAGVSLAANFVLAVLSAEQSAYTGGVRIAANSLSVISELNLADESAGAKAVTGASGRSDADVKLAAAGLTENKAVAITGYRNQAYLAGTGVEADGELTVLADSVARAIADVSTGTDISLFGVRLMSTTALTSAVNAAYIQAASSRPIEAGQISVRAHYGNVTTASVQPGGGLSGSLSLGSLSANVAAADAAMQAIACISGAGTIQTSGALTVRTTGQTSVQAAGKTARITVDALRVAVNVANASNRSVQSAYIDGALSIHAGGALTVETGLEAGKTNRVQAVSGGSAGSVTDDDGVGAFTLTLVGMTVNSASAQSAVSNRAYLKNTGSIQADALTVLANGAMEILAEARASSGISIALATIGALRAAAFAADDVQAGIFGGSATAKNDVSVRAVNSVSVNAIVEVPTVYAGVSVKTAEATAEIGSTIDDGVDAQEQTWSAPDVLKAHSVRAEITDAAKVVSLGGGIALNAQNTASAQAQYLAGGQFALAGLSYTELPVYGAYETAAYIGEGVELIAAGDITVLAEDDIAQRTVLYTGTIAVAAGAYLVAKHVIAESVKVNVGNAVVMVAGGDIRIQSLSGVTVESRIICNASGILTGAYVRSAVVLIREIGTGVGEGGRLSALGAVSILAGSRTPSAGTGGERYTLLNTISDTGAGLIGAGSVAAFTVNYVNTYVTIGGNDAQTQIAADEDVLIRAHNDLYTLTRCDTVASGVYGDRTVKAYADINLRAVVSVGTKFILPNDTNTGWQYAYGQLVTVTGRNITIQAAQGLVNVAVMNLLNVKEECTGTYDARSNVNMFQPVSEVNINNARLSAKDALRITASQTPEQTSLSTAAGGAHTGAHIMAITQIYVAAALGRYINYANISATKYSPSIVIDEAHNAIVRVGGLAILAAGGDITLASKDASAESYYALAAFTNTLFDHKGSAAYDIMTTAHTLVYGDARFYIGTGLGGASVHVAADGTVTANGVNAVKNAHTITISGGVAAGGAHGAGTIHLTGGSLNGNKIYIGGVSAADAGLTVNNLSNCTILFDGIDLGTRAAGGSAAVTVYYDGAVATSGYTLENGDLPLSGDGLPSGLRVYNFAGGAVIFQNVNNTGAQSTELSWLGEERGTLTSGSASITAGTANEAVAPLWTAGLSVSGNVDVGASLTPFLLYLIHPATGTASLNVDVLGDSYIVVAQAGVETLAEGASTSTEGYREQIRVANVVAAGVNSLTIDTARRFYLNADGTAWAAVTRLAYSDGYKLGPLFTENGRVTQATTRIAGSSVSLTSAYGKLIGDVITVTATAGDITLAGVSALHVWYSLHMSAAGSVNAAGTGIAGEDYLTTDTLLIASGADIRLLGMTGGLHALASLIAAGDIELFGDIQLYGPMARVELVAGGDILLPAENYIYITPAQDDITVLVQAGGTLGSGAIMIAAAAAQSAISVEADAVELAHFSCDTCGSVVLRARQDLRIGKLYSGASATAVESLAGSVVLGNFSVSGGAMSVAAYNDIDVIGADGLAYNSVGKDSTLTMTATYGDIRMDGRLAGAIKTGLTLDADAAVTLSALRGTFALGRQIGLMGEGCTLTVTAADILVAESLLWRSGSNPPPHTVRLSASNDIDLIGSHYSPIDLANIDLEMTAGNDIHLVGFSYSGASDFRLVAEAGGLVDITGNVDLGGVLDTAQAEFRITAQEITGNGFFAGPVCLTLIAAGDIAISSATGRIEALSTQGSIYMNHGAFIPANASLTAAQDIVLRGSLMLADSLALSAGGSVLIMQPFDMTQDAHIVISAGEDVGSAEYPIHIANWIEGAIFDIRQARDIVITVEQAKTRDDAEAAFALTAGKVTGAWTVIYARGGIQLTQSTGDMRIKLVRGATETMAADAAAALRLTAAEGSILSAAQDAANIVTRQDIVLTAQKGGIGTVSAPILIGYDAFATGSVQATAQGVVALSATGNLSIGSIVTQGSAKLVSGGWMTAAADCAAHAWPHITARGVTLVSYGGDIASALCALCIRLLGGSCAVTLPLGSRAYIHGAAFTLSRVQDSAQETILSDAQALFHALGGSANATFDAGTGVITLTNDVVLSAALVLRFAANATVTLNLNTHTVTAGNAKNSVFVLESGRLCLQDGFLDKAAGQAEHVPETVRVTGGTLRLANVGIARPEAALIEMSGMLLMPGVSVEIDTGGAAATTRIEGRIVNLAAANLTATDSYEIVMLSEKSGDTERYSLIAGEGGQAILLSPYQGQDLMINGSNSVTLVYVVENGAAFPYGDTEIETKIAPAFRLKANDAEALLDAALYALRWYRQNGALYEAIASAPTDAGVYRCVVALTQAGAREYCLAAGQNEYYIHIEPQTLTPALTLTGVSDGTYGTAYSVNVDYDSSLPVRIEYSLDGSLWQDDNFVITQAGTTRVYCRAVSTDGNYVTDLSAYSADVVISYTALKMLVVPADSSRTYDGEDKPFTIAFETLGGAAFKPEGFLLNQHYTLTVKNKVNDPVSACDPGAYDITPVLTDEGRALLNRLGYDVTGTWVLPYQIDPDPITPWNLYIYRDYDSDTTNTLDRAVIGAKSYDRLLWSKSYAPGQTDFTGWAEFGAGFTFTDVADSGNFYVAQLRTGSPAHVAQVSVTILPLQLSDVATTDYMDSYDGEAHTIGVTGTQAGDMIRYRVGESGAWTEDAPYFTGVMTQTKVYVSIARENYTTIEAYAHVQIDPLALTIVVTPDGWMDEPIYVGDEFPDLASAPIYLRTTARYDGTDKLTLPVTFSSMLDESLIPAGDRAAVMKALGDYYAANGTITAYRSRSSAQGNRVYSFEAVIAPQLAGMENYLLALTSPLAQARLMCYVELEKASYGTLSVEGGGKTYDGTPIAHAGAVSGAQTVYEEPSGEVAIYDEAFTFSYAYEKYQNGAWAALGGAPKDAGQYRVLVTASNPFFHDKEKTVAFTIAQRALTGLTLTAANKVADGTNEASVLVTTTPDNILAADYVNVLITNASFASAELGAGIAVSYEWSLSGTGAGNYSLPSVKPALTADILPSGTGYTLQEGMFETLEGNTYIFSGVMQTPAIALTAAGSGLLLGSDYVVTYENNYNAGTAIATITGIGAYTGSVTRSFVIAPKALDNHMFQHVEGTYTYNGQAQTPLISLTDGTLALIAGTDYTVSSASVNAGAATLNVTGQGNYSGALTNLAYTIQKAPLRPADFTFQTAYAGAQWSFDELSGYAGGYGPYGNDKVEIAATGVITTGSAVTLYLNQFTLLSGGNNYEIADGCFVRGTGTFTPVTITDIVIPAISKSYDETTVAAAVVTGFSGILPGDDVSVSVSAASFKDILPGENKPVSCTLTLSGADAQWYCFSNGLSAMTVNTTGSIVQTGSIALKDGMLSLTIADGGYTYDGTAKTPGAASATPWNLLEGTHYTLAYRNNLHAGMATAIVTGIDGSGYTGTLELTFTIGKVDIGDVLKSVSDAIFSATDGAVPTLTFTAALTENEQYLLKLLDNRAAGTGKLIIRGTGDYSGTAERTFTIQPKSGAGAAIEVGAASYTGDACEPAVTVRVDGVLLEKGTDYTVVYSDNVAVGTAAKLMVVFTGNYGGTASATFSIAAQPIADLAVSVGGAYYDGALHNPAVTIKNGSITLVEGTHYRLAFSHDIALGTGVVRIIGLGGYTGQLDKAFTIAVLPAKEDGGDTADAGGAGDNGEPLWAGMTAEALTEWTAQLPSPDTSLSLEDGGLGRPDGMDEAEYRQRLEQLAQELHAILGYIDDRISDTVNVPAQTLRQMEDSYAALMDILEPDKLHMLNADTGTRLTLNTDANPGADTDGLRGGHMELMELTEADGAYRALSALLGENELILAIARLSIARPDGSAYTPQGDVVLTLRVRAFQRVTFWYLDEAGEWRSITLTADGNGDVTVTVPAFTAFALTALKD